MSLLHIEEKADVIETSSTGVREKHFDKVMVSFLVTDIKNKIDKDISSNAMEMERLMALWRSKKQYLTGRKPGLKDTTLVFESHGQEYRVNLSEDDSLMYQCRLVYEECNKVKKENGELKRILCTIASSGSAGQALDEASDPRDNTRGFSSLEDGQLHTFLGECGKHGEMYKLLRLVNFWDTLSHNETEKQWALDAAQFLLSNAEKQTDEVASIREDGTDDDD
ncbi:MAG: hypothetical protein SGARI_008228 [Bacillariaceae sp.]